MQPARRIASRRQKRGTLAPGTRLGALDLFARAHPAAAVALVPGCPRSGRLFGRHLFARLDEAIRSARGDSAMAAVARGFRDVLASPARVLFIEAIVADAQETTERRAAIGLARSLWGVTPIINLKTCAAADRRLGVEAETVVATTYYITRDFDLVIAAAPDCYEPWTWAVFSWALLSFDNFYYFNDRGLLAAVGGYGSERFGISIEEMRLLRRAGKALYTMAYGADYRTRAKTVASGKFNFCMDCPAPGTHCLCDDEGGRRVLETIAEHATATLGIGLALDYLPKPRPLNYLAVDLTRFIPTYADPPVGRPLRVAHAPNHAFFKGTRHLEAAIERLRGEGHVIELVKLSGVPNEEVLRLIESSDLVADQFIGGNFGYTAIEAMALGKPVLSYVRDGLRVPDPAAFPIINANPDTLYGVLKDLLAAPERLPEIGRRSRAYVEAHYSVDSLARELRQLYRETNPNAPRWLESSRDDAIRQRVRSLALATFDAARAAIAAPIGQLAHLVRVTRAVSRALAILLYSGLRTVLFTGAVAIGRLATARRLRRGTVRSIWGTTPILTLPLLAECDRRLGLESQSLVFTTYYISQRFDLNLKPVLDRLVARAPKLYRLFFDLVFAWALVRFDVFHFFCDRGVLPSAGRMGINRREVALLRRAGKRLYTYTYGADVRTRAQTLALGPHNFCVDCPEPGRFCICDDAAGSRNVRAIAEHATAMLAMGDMLAYVSEARELHFWPMDLDRFAAVPPSPRADRPLRVFHAPNHPHFKGTRHLEAAVNRLRSEGHAIELISVSGVPNEELVRQMATCDIVAEQFIGGFHGYTALEAMACGKPVICYIRDRRQLAGTGECPIIDADPDSLEGVLRDCVLGRYDLAELGRHGRRYVEKYFSIDAVAARLGRLYLGTARLPDEQRRRVEHSTAAIEARLAEIRVMTPETVSSVT